MNLSCSEIEIVRDNDPLVKHIVKRIQRKCRWYRRVPWSDLVQAGRLGMLRGIRTFDAQKGTKPSTWIGHHIQWEISLQYGADRNKDPLLRAWPIRDVPDPHDDFEEINEHDESIDIARRVHEALEELEATPFVMRSGKAKSGSRLALVLRMRYGIDDREHSLAEISQKLKVTRERARQIVLDGERQIESSKAFLSYRQAEWEEMQERRAADQARLARIRRT